MTNIAGMTVHQNSSLRLSWICAPIASGGSVGLARKAIEK